MARHWLRSRIASCRDESLTMCPTPHSLILMIYPAQYIWLLLSPFLRALLRTLPFFCRQRFVQPQLGSSTVKPSRRRAWKRPLVCKLSRMISILSDPTPPICLRSSGVPLARPRERSLISTAPRSWEKEMCAMVLNKAVQCVESIPVLRPPPLLTTVCSSTLAGFWPGMRLG